MPARRAHHLVERGIHRRLEALAHAAAVELKEGAVARSVAEQDLVFGARGGGGGGWGCC